MSLPDSTIEITYKTSWLNEKGKQSWSANDVFVLLSIKPSFPFFWVIWQIRQQTTIVIITRVIAFTCLNALPSLWLGYKILLFYSIESIFSSLFQLCDISTISFFMKYFRIVSILSLPATSLFPSFIPKVEMRQYKSIIWVVWCIPFTVVTKTNCF